MIPFILYSRKGKIIRKKHRSEAIKELRITGVVDYEGVQVIWGDWGGRNVYLDCGSD